MSSIPPEVNRAISMTEIRESLKSNPIYLRVCIQYEVLEGMPCWESYQSFCTKLGKDAMEYIDFEFWFMRFYNGETDLEYNRSKDAGKKTIMDLPTDLMTHIAKDYLKPFDMVMLSQVSRNLQSFCGTLDPGTKKVELHMSPTGSVIITFEKLMILYKPAYGMKKNGYEIGCGYERIRVENGDHLDGVRDVLMTQFSSKTSTVSQLTVIVDSKGIEEWKKLVEKLSFRSKISVKTVRFVADDPIHFLPLLYLLTPGYLEQIEISNHRNIAIPYQRLMETEQWKQAKRAVMLRDGPSNPEHFQYFNRFEEFTVTIDELTMEVLMELSYIYIASPHFKSCTIESDLLFQAGEFASEIGGYIVDDSPRVVRYSNGAHVLEYRGDFGDLGGTLRIEKKEVV
ncbi:hypothetical protein CAEBREN_15766 [Caenorhabditis brenneri]|uniref:F-box domain-containing protein n=1 Tax=Caenorhabditis brenneri TaxID=135651 RepID=G0NGG0_CAEBE|nr:hypothetical protein CAEBREN_15766 [Caenorhabditis brenneri]